jgi:hypothetical protein
MIDNLAGIARVALWVLSLAFLAAAVLEKIANTLGYTWVLADGRPPSVLIEYTVIPLLFVVALEVRELRRSRTP